MTRVRRVERSTRAKVSDNGLVRARIRDVVGDRAREIIEGDTAFVRTSLRLSGGRKYRW
jgi:hypothetical protein